MFKAEAVMVVKLVDWKWKALPLTPVLRPRTATTPGCFTLADEETNSLWKHCRCQNAKDYWFSQ